jgi:predicted HTH transcriptional regulator
MSMKLDLEFVGQCLMALESGKVELKSLLDDESLDMLIAAIHKYNPLLLAALTFLGVDKRGFLVGLAVGFTLTQAKKEGRI